MSSATQASQVPTSAAFSQDKYRFFHALRPFSLVVALTSAGLGIVLGWPYAQAPWPLAALILIASLLLQAGVNLINDYGDRHQLDTRFPQVGAQTRAALSQSIRFNFHIGLTCIFLATLLGIFLAALSGITLLWIGVIGLAGALFYTLEPINYKQRGLGVLSVFWLMGVLMVLGAYFVMSQHLNWQVLWQAIPLSCLTSLLLLSNELRDYERDLCEGQYTLSVRLGYQKGVFLYYLLCGLTIISTLILALQSWLPYAPLLLLSLLALPAPLKLLQAPPKQRLALTPLTGRLQAVYGGLSLLCYGLSL